MWKTERKWIIKQLLADKKPTKVNLKELFKFRDRYPELYYTKE